MRKRLVSTLPKVRVPKVKTMNPHKMVNGLYIGMLTYINYTHLGEMQRGYLFQKESEDKKYGGKPPIGAGRGGVYYHHHSRHFT